MSDPLSALDERIAACDVCEYEFEGGDRKRNVVCSQCWPHDNASRHYVDVIAANQIAFDALQVNCESRLREKDALIEHLRSLLERCVGATVTLPATETQDPRYKHILSGDYYEPGKKGGG